MARLQTMLPPCSSDKHENCYGANWNEKADIIFECVCVCHESRRLYEVRDVLTGKVYGYALGERDVLQKVRDVATQRPIPQYDIRAYDFETGEELTPENFSSYPILGGAGAMLAP